ncbi:hypothetical protein ACFLXE_07620, partial [Chloroflexota bacterium]
TAQRTRIRQLGEQYQLLLASLEKIEQDLLKAEGALKAAEDELKGLEEERDPGELRRLVERAVRHGDLEANFESTRAELADEVQQAGIELERLGLWSGTLEQAELLPIPPAETIDRFEAQLRDGHSEVVGLVDRIQRTQDEITDIDRELEELRLAGSVPSEDALTEARARRDLGWRLVRRAWLESEDVSAEARAYDFENDLPEAYERSVTEADSLGDRLRREAARVERNASLAARRARLEQELSKVEQDKSKVESEIEQNRQEWNALWQPVGITPLPPKEMRSWVTRQNGLATRAASVRQYQRSVQEMGDRIDEYHSELSHCLESMGGKPATGDESLVSLVDRSQALVGMIEEANRRRKELRTEVNRLKKDRDDFGRNKEQSEARLDQWRRDWAKAIEPLGLAGEVSPAEANAVLDRYEEVFRNVDEADKLDLRIQGIHRGAEEFAADVKASIERVAPDLLDMPADQAAAQLNGRLTRALQDARTLDQLEKQVLQREEDIREARDTIEAMTAKLDEMCTQAGCARYEELEVAEERSLQVQSWRGEIRMLEDQLLDLGGGATLGQLLEEAEQADADSLPGRIAEISVEEERLETEIERLRREVYDRDRAVKEVDGGPRAAEAAEEAQEILAAISSGVERYLRLRMASIILKREIERYRSENQGPLLRRAGELFSQLTLGSFSGLQTDYDEKDELVLLGLRPSEERVGVSGMSDGTLDQLYLSLRLASLERYLETNEPMPFVVDDILIRFDDDRAGATLKVLADLATKTQVIFFTHHSRLVEMARGLFGEGTVYVSTLQ